VQLLHEARRGKQSVRALQGCAVLRGRVPAQALGRAVQVEPLKLMLTAPESRCLISNMIKRIQTLHTITSCAASIWGVRRRRTRPNAAAPPPRE